jgi:hypothetical protein
VENSRIESLIESHGKMGMIHFEKYLTWNLEISHFSELDLCLSFCIHIGYLLPIYCP